MTRKQRTIIQEGMKFSRLIVVERVEAPKDKRQDKSYWRCICKCGNESIVVSTALTQGHSKSCGCYGKERMKEIHSTHGLSKTRFSKIWKGMKNRCNNENYKEYHLYGGKGIKVSESWQTCENFVDDMYESYVEFEKEHGKDSATLDRINPNENYCKENCRWATQLEQARNRSDNISVVIEGKEYPTLTAVAEEYNLNYQLVSCRYRNGKRGLELVAPPKFNGSTKTRNNGITVEVNGITYDSLTALQKAHSYISLVTITKRYKKGLRGEELIKQRYA